LKRRAFGGRQLGHVYIYLAIAPAESSLAVEASQPPSVPVASKP
jgi:hypothetical protein